MWGFNTRPKKDNAMPDPNVRRVEPMRRSCRKDDRLFYVLNAGYTLEQAADELANDEGGRVTQIDNDKGFAVIECKDVIDGHEIEYEIFVTTLSPTSI